MRYSFIIILLILSLQGNAHPLHLSITNIDCKNDSLQISIRLYKTHQPNTINHCFNFIEADSLQNKPLPAINYLLSHFELMANNQSCKLSFSHQQPDDLSVWYFFTGALPKNWNQVILKNTLLTDIFNDQKNIVIVSRNNAEQGFEFDANTIQLLILQTTAESHDE
ncbi:MAG: DUF6702 family protein [Salinivirgaceae bacterium]